MSTPIERKLAAHRLGIDSIIDLHDGRVVNTAGDSVLAEFTSPVEAVSAASEIQDALKTRNESLPEHGRMLFRIGVHLGDVMIKETTGKLSLRFQDIGEQAQEHRAAGAGVPARQVGAGGHRAAGAHATA